MSGQDRRAAVQESRAVNVLSRCKLALKARLRQLRPDAAWINGFDSYLLRLEDNLLPGITPDLFRDDYSADAGGELDWEVRHGVQYPPKMHAAHSSSALVVNDFAPWKERTNELRLSGIAGFAGLRFEAQMPTQLRGTAPHVDVLLESSSGNPVGAKFLLDARQSNLRCLTPRREPSAHSI
jgi:hypothetical protein